jgi:hypothetical protein
VESVRLGVSFGRADRTEVADVPFVPTAAAFAAGNRIRCQPPLRLMVGTGDKLAGLCADRGSAADTAEAAVAVVTVVVVMDVVAVEAAVTVGAVVDR